MSEKEVSAVVYYDRIIRERTEYTLWEPRTTIWFVDTGQGSVVLNYFGYNRAYGICKEGRACLYDKEDKLLGTIDDFNIYRNLCIINRETGEDWLDKYRLEWALSSLSIQARSLFTGEVYP